MSLVYKNISKHNFCGYFIHNESFDGYVASTPALGFSVNAEFNPPPFPDQDHLSFRFSNLENPADIFYFAQEFGALFGNSCRSLALSPVEKEGGFATFPQNASSIEALFEDILELQEEDCLDIKDFFADVEMEELAYFEALEDWVTSIQLMRRAYQLADLLHRDDLRVETCPAPYEFEGTVFELFCDNDSAHMRFRSDGEGTWFEMEEVRTPSDYLKNVWNLRKRFASESSLLGQVPRTAQIMNDWLGEGGESIEFFVREPGAFDTSRERGLIKMARRLMEAVLCEITASNAPVAGFALCPAGVSYEFDSLNSFLWFDFMLAINDKRGFSCCERCGRPFLRGNRGHTRLFCSDTCRKLHYKHMKREANKQVKDESRDE